MPDHVGCGECLILCTRSPIRLLYCQGHAQSLCDIPAHCLTLTTPRIALRYSSYRRRLSSQWRIEEGHGAHLIKTDRICSVCANSRCRLGLSTTRVQTLRLLADEPIGAACLQLGHAILAAREQSPQRAQAWMASAANFQCYRRRYPDNEQRIATRSLRRKMAKKLSRG